MAEYIDREAALKAIAEDKIEMTPELIAIGRAIGTYTAEQAFDGINQACDRHIESIKIIPAADVQPVKHGRWVFNKPPNDWAEMRLSTKSFYVCDICGHVVYDISNYCPGCGSVMDGGDF